MVVTWRERRGYGEKRGGGAGGAGGAGEEGAYPVRVAPGCPANQKMRKEVHPCCLFAFGPCHLSSRFLTPVPACQSRASLSSGATRVRPVGRHRLEGGNVTALQN